MEQHFGKVLVKVQKPWELSLNKKLNEYIYTYTYTIHTIFFLLIATDKEDRNTLPFTTIDDGSHLTCLYVVANETVLFAVPRLSVGARASLSDLPPG